MAFQRALFFASKPAKGLASKPGSRWRSAGLYLFTTLAFLALIHACFVLSWQPSHAHVQPLLKNFHAQDAAPEVSPTLSLRQGYDYGTPTSSQVPQTVTSTTTVQTNTASVVISSNPSQTPPPSTATKPSQASTTNTAEKYRLNKLGPDTSKRCQASGICDGDISCGKDNLGCVTDPKQRALHIVEAAKWSWEGYRKYAWGQDEVDVRNHQGRYWFGLGVTIVDSLDTLLILNMTDEYKAAREWVANSLNFDAAHGEISVFETTIRILGGLVSAYYHSGGDVLYLKKAEEFGKRLMPAFAETGIAVPFYQLGSRTGHGYGGATNLAEAGSLSVEFSALSRVTADPQYRTASMRFWAKLKNLANLDGLFCTKFGPGNMQCYDTEYQFGPAADSMYEYMLKQWVLTGGEDKECVDFYKAAMGGMRKHLLARIQLVGDDEPTWILTEGHGSGGGVSQTLLLFHLTCFVPGMLTLGHMNGINTANSTAEPDDLQLAALLMKGCYNLYRSTATGVAVDGMRFQKVRRPPASSPQASPVPSPVSVTISAVDVSPATSGGTSGTGAEGTSSTSGTSAVAAAEQLVTVTRKLLSDPAEWQQPYTGDLYAMVPNTDEDFLRPEVIESLFYLWRATHDPVYREWGWSMFRSFNQYSRVADGGFAILRDVTRIPPTVGDKMESFWIAETLKYFYLLFTDDDVIPLDQFVFNTEAHPLPIWDKDWEKQFMGAGKGVNRKFGGDAGVVKQLRKLLQQLKQQRV